jgi:hypothetical protein
MDLQLHYNKVRQEEQRIGEEFPVICSHETADGGKPGILVEVTRRIAARFITLGLARIATGEEKKIFADSKAEAKRVAEEALTIAQQTTAALLARGFERIGGQLKAKE